MARLPESFCLLARELASKHHEVKSLKAKLAEKEALLADYARIYGANASERLYKAPSGAFAGVACA